MPCFWCGTSEKVKKSTRDHLYSKYLRSLTGEDPGVVACCKPCNQARGYISNVYEIIHRTETGNWVGRADFHQPQCLPKVVKRLLGRVKLANFRTRINERIKPDKVREFCLLEIDTILKYAREHPWSPPMQATVITPGNPGRPMVRTVRPEPRTPYGLAFATGVWIALTPLSFVAAVFCTIKSVVALYGSQDFASSGQYLGTAAVLFVATLIAATVAVALNALKQPARES